MNLITKSGLAKAWNIEPSRITALLNEGKLKANAEGKIDLDDPKNKEYIEARKISVPKYLGLGVDDSVLESEDISENSSNDSLFNKKEAEAVLYQLKIDKERKLDQLLDLKLKAELKQIVSTDVLNKVVLTCFDTFQKALNNKPYEIIDRLRHIILSGGNKNNEDIEFLIDSYGDIYRRGLEQSRKFMLEYYGTKSESNTC